MKNTNNKIETKDLINWGELSRMLSGSRQTVEDRENWKEKREQIKRNTISY